MRTAPWHIRAKLRRNGRHVNTEEAFIEFSAYPGRGKPPEHSFSEAIRDAMGLIERSGKKSLDREFTDYQKSAISFFMELDPDLSGGRKGAIYDPMGVGKTPTAVGIAMALGRQAFPIVVIRPNAAASAWEDVFKEWFSPPMTVTRTKAITADGSWITAAARAGREVIAITPESLNSFASLTRTSGDWADAVQTTLAKNGGGGLLIIDEAHFLRSHDSLRTVAAVRLAQCFPNLLVMTGTPGLKSALESIGILEALSRATPDDKGQYQPHFMGADAFERAQQNRLGNRQSFSVSRRGSNTKTAKEGEPPPPPPLMPEHGALWDFLDYEEASSLSSALRRRGVRRSRYSIESAGAHMAGGKSFLQKTKRRVPVIVPLDKNQQAFIDTQAAQSTTTHDAVSRFNSIIRGVSTTVTRELQRGASQADAIRAATQQALAAARTLYVARPVAVQRMYSDVTRTPAVEIATDLAAPFSRHRQPESSVIFVQSNPEGRRIFDLLRQKGSRLKGVNLILYNSNEARIRRSKENSDEPLPPTITAVQAAVRAKRGRDGVLTEPFILVITMDSAQVGLNLKEINYVIMPDRADTPGIEEQAEDRINRADRDPSQPMPTIIYLIPAEPFALAMAHRQENRRLNLRYMFGPPAPMRKVSDPDGGSVMFEYNGVPFLRSSEFMVNDDNTEPLPLPASQVLGADDRGTSSTQTRGLAEIYEFVRDPSGYIAPHVNAAVAMHNQAVAQQAQATAASQALAARQAAINALPNYQVGGPASAAYRTMAAALKSSNSQVAMGRMLLTDGTYADADEFYAESDPRGGALIIKDINDEVYRPARVAAWALEIDGVDYSWQPQIMTNPLRRPRRR